MVGRKKRSNSTRNHFVSNAGGCAIEQSHMDPQDQVNECYENGRHVHRFAESGTRRNKALGGSDSENSTVTATYRRRPKYNNHTSNNHKTHPPVVNNYTLPKMNGSCQHRSRSREAGSASAGSIVSGLDYDEDGSPSGSGIDFEPDDPRCRLVEKRDVGIMTCEMAGCSVGTQTNAAGSNSDFLLGMCKLKKWQRLESVAEFVQCLPVYEQRYLGCCIEAAVRSNSSRLRQYEIRYNDARYIQSLIETLNYRKLLEDAFPIISLLHSTNRQAATVYFGLLKKLEESFEAETAEADAAEKEEILDTVRLAVSAALYHPAFSIEHKRSLEKLRSRLDAVATQHNNQGLNETATPPVDGVRHCCSSSSSNEEEVPVVISRLDIISPSDTVTSDEYSIEVVWSDNQTSYLVKTADQIAELHNRLLNDFPSEAGAQTENPRLLPYLNRAQPNSIVSYIRALPDLPARVLVCPIMRDFFYSSRLGSGILSSPPQSLVCPALPSIETVKVEREGASGAAVNIISAVPACEVSQTCAVAPSGFGPVTTICNPTSMVACSNSACTLPSSTLPPPPISAQLITFTRPIPLLTPAGVTYQSPLSLPSNPGELVTCCNCAGPHSFPYCPQPTMLQIIASGEYKLDFESALGGGVSGVPSDVTRSMVAVSSTSPPPKQSFSTPPPAASSH